MLIYCSIAVILFVVGVLLFLFGIICAADPEGRGGKYLLISWCFSAVCAIGFIVDCVLWFRS